MVEAGSKICDARELFTRMRQAALGAVAPECMTVKVPDYLPPVVIGSDADRWLVYAAVVIASWALPHGAIFATAYYEDRHDPVESAVVLSLAVRRTANVPETPVESDWLQEIGSLADELLARSVALALQAAGDEVVFELRLPVHGSDTRRSVHRDTIVLVEDDEFVRRVGQEVLEASGHRVVAKSSAEEAMSFCDQNRDSICLVISDITLPQMDGRQLATAVHSLLPKIPVLLISGYSQGNGEELHRGVYFLAKPFNAEALLGAAKRCLAEDRGAVSATPVMRRKVELATAFC